MDLVISILIYLGALVPNNSYSDAQVDEAYLTHEQEVVEVKEDEELTNMIYDANHDNFAENQTTGYVEVWHDETIIIE